MADYDQDLKEMKTEVLKTKEGIKRLALYNSSVGRLLLFICLTLFDMCTLFSRFGIFGS